LGFDLVVDRFLRDSEESAEIIDDEQRFYRMRCVGSGVHIGALLVFFALVDSERLLFRHGVVRLLM